MQFANLATSLNPLDPDKGERGATPRRARVRGGGQGDGVGKPPRPALSRARSVCADEEEEEEEDSEDELPQDMEALEPPAKLARTDTRGLFVQALPSS